MLMTTLEEQLTFVGCLGNNNIYKRLCELNERSLPKPNQFVSDAPSKLELEPTSA